jgi:peptidoglycan/LPS O-acetylase OafA/YrhL
MKSQNISYLPAVDHLRGFAAILVAVYHGLHFLTVQPDWQRLSNPLMIFLYEGHTGVALFFVISGFLFTYGAAGKEFNAAGFWFNRFLRIYPLFLLLNFLAAYIYPERFQPSAFFLTMVGLANVEGGILNTPLSTQFWTIAVECQFYALFPLLLWLFRSRGAAALFQIIGLAITLRLLCAALDAKNGTLAYFTIFGRIDQFIIGMLAASTMQRKPGAKFSAFLCCMILGALICFCYALHTHGGFPTQAWWRSLLPPIEASLWAGFLVLYIRAAEMWPPAIAEALIWLGERSYSIYLLNVAVVAAFAARHWILLPSLGWYWSSLVTMIPVLSVLILVSALTFRLVESPFMTMRRSYTKRAESRRSSPPEFFNSQSTAVSTAAQEAHHV